MKNGELTPQQTDFLRFYLDPKSETYSNAKASALKAQYSQDYAETITSQLPDWLSENLGRRKRMLEKAEKRLETLIDSEDEKVSADVSKFIAKTQGKDQGYSDRTEVTGKDGGELVITQVAYGDRDNDTSQVRTETVPVESFESPSESEV